VAPRTKTTQKAKLFGRIGVENLNYPLPATLL
jgi:hypothetical protein